MVIYIVYCYCDINLLSRVYNLFATDIMRKDLTFVSYESSYSDLKLLLETSSHASYPLVDAPSEYTNICSLPHQKWSTDDLFLCIEYLPPKTNTVTKHMKLHKFPLYCPTPQKRHCGSTELAHLSSLYLRNV